MTFHEKQTTRRIGRIGSDDYGGDRSRPVPRVVIHIGHRGDASSLAFAPDSSLVATGLGEDSVRPWPQRVSHPLPIRGGFEEDLFVLPAAPARPAAVGAPPAPGGAEGGCSREEARTAGGPGMAATADHGRDRALSIALAVSVARWAEYRRGHVVTSDASIKGVVSYVGTGSRARSRASPSRTAVRSTRGT